jgi:quinoprotein glucose dehydrogenase
MRRNFVRVFLILSGISAWAADHPFTTWSQYLGGPDSSQYSSLKQINKSNVARLEVAWTYPTGPGTFVFDPIVVDGVMYVLKQNNAIAALNAATGKELWVHPNTGAVGTRGMNYWESKDHSDRRLFFINAGFLTAIDARTGTSINTFGDNGRVNIANGLDRDPPRALQTNNPGRIFDNIIITPLPAGGATYDSNPADIHAWDVRTGKPLWTFHVVPHPGEFD